MSAPELAHIGDCVYELAARLHIASASGQNIAKAHKKTVRLVSAQAQAKAAKALQAHLTEEEISIYKRGRNSRLGSIPKNATPADYSAATGLETLFGALYLLSRHERLAQLWSIAKDEIEKGD